METTLLEIQRCGTILIHFILTLTTQLVIAGCCTVVGVGLFVAGRHVAIEAISFVGEAIIVCVLGYAAWRAIKAQFIAMGQILGWGK